MSPAGSAGKASPLERCLVIGEPELRRPLPRQARVEPRARDRRRHASARGQRRARPLEQPGHPAPARRRPAASTASSSRRRRPTPRRRRADPHRQGGRRARERAAADARGRRLGGRVRRRRRADDARRAAVRPLALVARAQARVRPRRDVARRCSPSRPSSRVIALAIRLDSAGPSSSARRASGRDGEPRSRSSSSARWSSTPTPQKDAAARAQRGRRRDVQDRRRPARHARRQLPAQDVARRAAAAASTCCAAR